MNLRLMLGSVEMERRCDKTRFRNECVDKILVID